MHTSRKKTQILRYDAVLKDLFQRDHPALLDHLTGGIAVRESLNVEFAVVQERRADLVLRLADGSLFHLDFQSGNDMAMAYRVGMYGLMIGQKFRRKVRQTVLYAGASKLRMPDRLDLGQIQVAYRLMDIRELDATTLLRSGRPGDCVLAVLARGGESRLRQILQKLSALPKLKRERALAQLTILSGLRRLSGKVRMEMKRMDLIVNIEENVILREIRDKAIAKGKAQGKTEGRAEIIRELLTTRFGPLPKWARVRLEKAQPAQLTRWARKVLTADSLENVLGKK